MVEALHEFRTADPAKQKKVFFDLKNQLIDPATAQAFVTLGGVEAISELITDYITGNSLAYALTGLETAMNNAYGWYIPDKLVDKLVELISSPNVNVAL